MDERSRCRRALAPWAALLALWTGAAAAATESETQWMKVTLEGRKIGHLQSIREVEGDRVRHRERMALEIDRGGIVLAVTTEEMSLETLAGEPVGFGARIGLTGIETVIEGSVRADGKAEVVTRAGGRETRREIDWPKGALLAEGARRFERAQSRAPGSKYRFTVFQPSDLVAVPVEVEVVGPSARDPKLTEVRHRMQLPGATMTLSGFVDREGEIVRATIPMMGLELEMIACSEACAKAPNQRADLLDRTVLRIAEPLPREALREGIVYTLKVRGAEAPALPTVAEQTAAADGGAVRVEVDPDAIVDRRPPVAADRAATRWLESDVAELATAAKQAAGDGDASERMKRLEQWVRAHVQEKNLSVGYASALETLRSRTGDCTEHALLLAAMGRAIGVPTRVVSGLAYAESWAGYQRVFVPHAWVQAWIGDRWRSYDAALPGYDAGHIALAVGDGDAAGFYGAVQLLGNLEVNRAVPSTR